MTTVFLAGSRTLGRLNEAIRERLDNILRQHFRVVVGDANGSDKALQQYLAEIDYKDVIVYCSGSVCRNNVGHWTTVNVPVGSAVRGRAFYTQKDKRMAEEADYGFMLWDGKSTGTITNVVELLKRNKKALVYVSPEKAFYMIAEVSDAQKLLTKYDKRSPGVMRKKIDLKRSLDELTESFQDSLIF